MATSTPTLQELRTLATTAAQLGGEALTHASVPRTAIAKEIPGDVVTEVDRAVELRIREHLSAARPDDRIVGEELPDSGTGSTGLEWFIDPIDGTSNFVHGLSLHCTSVAVYDSTSEKWLAGAIHLSASATTYAAAVGAGAQKLFADGTAVELTATPAPGAPRLLGVGLSYDPEARIRQLDDIRERMRDYDDMRSLGTAAYALCLVAEGVFASFVETDLFVYDWAAGALIAEEAGAEVARPEGLGRGAIIAHGRPPRAMTDGGSA
ncbi:inositol monophosphatase family protein [Microbacterium murale]|uniref:inositol-phosphate phosphatase n=1 Tax=Microbacterium murale TaxID=1081040 RepID=A0ABU0PB17_9MICO|nr:inositol monophosphatase family protein [Microbacterium murale]MDQ0644540.1 myo-inositol-1(or 4)-monophosphatase [Microbacterium murale]